MNVSWEAVIVAVAAIAAATITAVTHVIGETAFVALVSGTAGAVLGHVTTAWGNTPTSSSKDGAPW